jgi:phospholipase D1/2
MPAFENSQLMEPSGFVTRATLQLQFESLTRGDDSILSYIAKAMPGENALEIFHNHVCVCGLRQIDRWPNGEIRTEQLYVHSKAMVVDDRIAIIGSANINDRSMLGDRDSEVAVMIEDERFVRSMRLELWREHTCVNENDVIIAEPQSEACFRLWKECSRQNSNIHKNVFGTIPADHIKTRQSFVEHMNEATGLSTVHASDERRMDLLKDLKGRLVEFQLGFLEEEHDLYNPMPTTAALCPREVFS